MTPRAGPFVPARPAQPAAQSRDQWPPNGFMLKDASPARLTDAIRRVAAGETVVDAGLAAAAIAGPVNPLAAREVEVLRMAGDGADLVEIAAALVLSKGTPQQALAWFDAEATVLHTTLLRASAVGLDVHVVKLAWSMQLYLERRGLWDVWVEAQTALFTWTGSPFGRARRHSHASRVTAQ
jgi:hypothetical protein